MSRNEIPIAPHSAQVGAEEAAEQAATAAAAVASSAPSVLALGRHLAAVQWAHRLSDCAGLAARKVDPNSTSGQDERALLYERMQATREMIATTPASAMLPCWWRSARQSRSASTLVH